MKNWCTVGKDWRRRVLLLIGCIFSLVLQLRTLVSFRQHVNNAASATAGSSNLLQPQDNGPVDPHPQARQILVRSEKAQSQVEQQVVEAAANLPRSSDQKTPSLTASNSSTAELSQTTVADKKVSSSEASPHAASTSSEAAATTPAADTTDSSKHHTHLDWSRVKEMDRPKETFQRYDQVAVVTKVAGPEYLGTLQQMICLFTAAYNRHVNYDIIVFTTLPWEPHQIQELQAVVPDTTKLVVELEGPPLAERVAQLDPVERELLYRRCNVPAEGGVLSWNHYCAEEPNTTQARKYLTVKLSYAWQAEFRAYHVWNVPMLQPYKYMMWIDSDAYATKPWSKDPMKLFIENDLALFFDHRRGDMFDNTELLNLTVEAYNRTLCRVDLKDGHLNPVPCTGVDDWYVVATVHGFFHITNLDFYRSERSMRFLKTLVRKQKFSREWDDQIAVTIPAVMDAPERSWDMRSHGLHMGVLHNGNMDGQPDEMPVKDERYTTYWNEKVKREWNAASQMCNEFVLHSG